MMRSQEKVILISGGTSGVGLESAKEFLAKGHRVIILGRKTQKFSTYFLPIPTHLSE